MTDRQMDARAATIAVDPPWLDRALYPFAPHAFETADGRLRYVDVGVGAPIVFVHGTPTWSFLYRHLIADLSRDHRCIAPDQLGFGLSDKPTTADYRPQAHARRLGALLDALDLRDITLVVHDYGGPIGVGAALERPGLVGRLVVFNSWMWSFAQHPTAYRASAVLGGRLGRLLYERLNFSARAILPVAYGDRTKLTPAIHRHYLRPQETPQQRQALWVLAREIRQSEAFFDSLWARRAAIAALPCAIVWGLKDPALPLSYLARWRELFPAASVVSFADAGHFVPEEQPQASIAAIRQLLATATGSA